jgi:hypothetical protein
MTPDEAGKAASDQATVVARTAQGDECGRGTVIAYSIVPTVTIERPDGSRFDWRHDMVEPADESALERLTRYNEADEAQVRELEARVAAVLGATTSRRWEPLPIPEPRTPAEAVRRVLIYHRGALKVGTFGEECLCGWEGESWADHVAPLLVRAAHTMEVSR